MGWSIGYDENWKRDIGYGVVAYCDHPECYAEIDRGLAYVCAGQEPYGGEKGCGLYFCDHHADYKGRCRRCARYNHTPYKPKPEHPDWIRWKLTHESWESWRQENPEEVEKLKEQRYL